MKVRYWSLLFSSHFLAYEFRLGTFQNERGKMNNYRKGGDKKKMIINDFECLVTIILIISIILMIRRYY